MLVYLVRHGETDSNAKRIYQNGESALSKKGIYQAQQLAERLSNIPVDLLIASPFVRARQTAQIISEKVKIPIEFNPLLIEVKRPTQIDGKSIHDPEASKIMDKIHKNWEKADFRHSDEETFSEFKDRAEKIIKQIEKIDKEHVVSVTHGDLIVMIVCFLTFKEKANSHQFLSLRKLFLLTNTGITVLKYENKRWRLLSWNDVSHIPS